MTPRTPTLRMHALLALAVLAVGLGSQAWGYHGCANHAGGTGSHGAYAAAASNGTLEAHPPARTHGRDAGTHALDAGTRSQAAPEHVGHESTPDAPAHAHAQHPADSKDAGHGPCTCLGTCHGSAPATTLAAAPPIAPSAIVVRQPRVRAVDTRAPATRPAFLIPYSTAPPLSA